MANQAADVFISYKAEDRRRLKPLVDALEADGFSVWWDVHIGGGHNWREDIQEHLDAAGCVIVAWSKRSVGREGNFVRDEAARAQRRGAYLPICLDPVDPPLGFGEVQALPLTGWRGDRTDARYQAVVKSLRSRIGRDADLSAIPPHKPRWSRRGVVLGLAGAAAAVGGIAYWGLGHTTSPPDPKAAALLDQAWQSWSQGTSEGNNQAIGLYRRATSIAPDYADAWGFLGCAYGDRGHSWVTGEERDECWERAREAGRRALELDERNAYGRAAIAYARPRRGNWGLMEREFLRAEHDQPDKWLIVYSLGLLMGDVGRFAEAARFFARLKGAAPTATQYEWHVQALWASGQLDAAERLLDEATGIYGSSEAIWWQRFDMLLNGGRANAAIALAQDPPGIVDKTEMGQAVAVAEALRSSDPRKISTVTQELRDSAVEGSYAAGRSVEFAGLLGQVDTAFEIAEALYFSRGFAIPDLPARSGSPPKITLDERRPRLLFLPSTKPMRADPRFEKLVGELDLSRYWHESSSLPDYRRT